MSIGRVVSDSALAAASELRRGGMRGRIILPGGAAYQRARTIYNAAVSQRPELFAVCETREDVQVAVRVARKRGLPLSVRGGGHDWAGRALCEGGLVIDLTGMRRVTVDEQAQVGRLQGGATGGDLAAAAGEHGLVGMTAASGTVGLAGLTLGGGYGPLSPRYGLAIDNLLGAEVVLACGECVIADHYENPDLFWALRGGGGNFGVVTGMRVQLHPQNKLFGGQIVYRWSEAKAVLSGYAELARTMPDELATLGGIFSDRDGTPVVLLAPIWCGDPYEGEEYIGQLLRLGAPLMAQIGPLGLSEVLDMFDAHLESGLHVDVQTRSLPALTSDAIAHIVTAVNARTSPLSAIVWHHAHGVPTRVPMGATPFGVRSEHFMIDIVAAWEDSGPRVGTVHRQWGRALSQALAPLALPGGYPNMLGPHEHDQIRHAYGKNLARLQNLKKRFDPDRVFTSATPLPTEEAALPT